MKPELRDILVAIQPAPRPDPESLVFTSPMGYVIDSGNFRVIWQEILKACQVPYRRPHVIRHTTFSYAAEQGTPLTGIAYMAGHTNTRMVIQTYGHMINRPDLPDIPI